MAIGQFVMTPPPDDTFSSQPRDAGLGPPPRDLHPTTDIRFVIVEVSKLAERVDNLINTVTQQDGRDEKRAEKLERLIEKTDTKIDQKSKELGDELDSLKTSATYVKGWLAGLTFVGIVIGYLFHDQLRQVAEAVARLAK